MKTISFIALQFFSCFVILCSCKKKEEPPAPHQNIFAAKVNGVPFVPKEISLSSSPYGSSPAFFLWSRDANNRVVQVIMKAYTSSPKNATIDSTNSSVVLANFEEGIGAYYMRRGISGNLSISSVDKTTYTNGEVVSGSFQFVTEEGIVTPSSYAITEGKFSVFLPK
jgi:hypothetical protein